MSMSSEKMVEALRASLVENERLRRRNKELLSAADEPVAIVGMGCRYPGGVESPEGLWRLVLEETDAVTGFPADRGWDTDRLYDPEPRHGRTYAREAGFLDGAGEFDAGFFGISPREALVMDPQQRLLLETSWEAVERSGIDPSSLRGSRTGVFIGATDQDYGPEPQEASEETAGYLLSGNASAVLSGRISYVLGLEGPAVTVDTACSSSLVALHQACQALRQGECEMALAGGVAVLATPGAFIEFSRQRGLAPDGRCKSFADGADGTAWGEGVGVVVVERLSRARELGHRVLAVVRGSAVNQDGASNGLTAPSGPSQQRVIRQALARSGVGASDVDVVEAHGTGTRLGDPIEAQALLATYGRGRDAGRPLWLGSLKSNIGHTQAAAGVGGVIKMVLAMRHGVLPRTLHVDAPSTEVDWSQGEVRLLTEQRPWPRSGPRRAAVSAFGVSGTNAHVVLEHARTDEPSDRAEPGPVDGTEPRRPDSAAEAPNLPWVLSAASAEALRAQAERLSAHLAAEPAADPADVGYSLATGRAALTHRAVLTGATGSPPHSALAALARGEEPSGAVLGAVPPAGPGRTAFLFTGQGSQRVGMGRELSAAFPAFAAAYDEVTSAFTPHLEHPLADVCTDGSGLLDRTEYTQPALFALEVALARLMTSWGIRPDHLIGHSIGELVAAHLAGVLPLPDAAALVAARGRLMGALPVGGAMAAVQATEEEVLPLLAEAGSGSAGERLSLAAVNGPDSVVVSGDETAVERVAAHFRTAGRRVRRLRVSHAFHSPHMDGMLADFRAVAASLTYGEPHTPVVSNVTGRPAAPGELASADYWVRHVRDTVRFHEGMRTLEAEGVTSYLELGPDSVLTALGRGCLTAPDEAVMTGLLRKDRPEPATAVAAVGRLWAHGAPVDWGALYDGTGAGRTNLPTYAFQRARYWLPRTPAAPDTTRDPATAGFWGAVEQEDAAGLADTLGVPAGDLAPVLPALARWHRGAGDRAETEAWRYRLSWRRQDPASAPALAGRWLVVLPDGGDGAHRVGQAGDGPAEWLRALPAALAEHGAEVVPVAVPTTHAPSREVLAAQLRSTLTDPSPVTGVVSLLALAEETEAAREDTGAAALALVQALGDTLVTAPLWTLTRGAVRALGTDPAPRPRQAQVWGLGRVAALEYPERCRGLLDLPPSADPRTARRVVALLAGDGAEDQVAVRPGGTYARRLLTASADTGRQPGWTPRGTVLITGGTGALGAHVARELAASGAEHLVLAGRRGAEAPGAAELSAELTAAGARVTLAACDVSDREALARLLDAHPPRAVVHAAGEALVRSIEETTPDDLARLWAAKAEGALHLDALLADRTLDAFLLFTSVAGAWGVAGQGGYAAANAALDALAEARRARGATATALAWGPWAGGGMVADAGIESQVSRRGLRPLDPRLAVLAMMSATGTDDAQTVVADVDWPVFTETFTALRPSPLLADLAAAATPERPVDQDAAAGSAATGALRARLARTAPAERRAELLEVVRGRAAGVLGLADSAALEPDRAFRDLGFDSLTAVELRQRLGTDTGLALPTTLVFDHPSAAALTDHLLSELGLGAEEQAETAPAPVAATTVTDEPIAVVGMACRYPEAETPEELWRLLADGVDAISSFPTDRGWDLAGVHDPERRRGGTSYTDRGGFLSSAGEFDAGFFGISPREALAMDPQQRLLLETSWEAVERSGIDPSSLRGSRTGVFIGASTNDYGPRTRAAAEEVEGFLLTGTTGSVASGRISYALGLEGPAVTVDTACSSSLVALHHACQALRQGECEAALAGGATVLPTPAPFVEFSRQGGLAPDGRCKSFADGADGTAWGEGVGVVVVERLSRARELGHRVLAVVRGSAVNQDGASNGLTAPSGPSQQRVIRQALARSGVGASEVDVVEAHGTGTRLGDPIEAQALLATYGRGRDAGRPLWLGSLKSNIGHTAAAGGIAGLIKMVLAMRHGVLPRTLHVDAPSTEVDWSQGEVRLLTEQRPWPRSDRPRLAAVSSFGISGTNAHLILEEPAAGPPATEDTPEPADLPVPWVLSAKSAEALRAQAGTLAGQLATDAAARPVDVGAGLVTGRAVFDHRAVLIGRDARRRAAGLAALARGATAPELVTGVRPAGPAPSTAYLFTGQGSQRAGMGQQLYAAFPAFAAAFDEVAGALDPHLEQPLRDVVFAAPRTGRAALLDETTWAQPALFALEVALYRCVEECGPRPDHLVGHSVGEYAAAHVAGVLDLPDAAALVAARGRLMGRLSARGAMLAVRASEADVLPVLAECTGPVALAAVNGPASVVVSGSEEAVSQAATALARQGVRTRRLTVSHAFHSPLMEPMLADFHRVADEVTFHPARLPLISTVTGRPVDATELSTPGYWVDQVRRPVRFAEAVRAAEAAGAGLFLEIGPDAVLSGMAQEVLPGAEQPLATQRRDRPEPETLLTALAQAHVRGAAVDWEPLFAPWRPRPVELPTYPFQRRHYWLADRPEPEPAEAPAAAFWEAVRNQDLTAFVKEFGDGREDASETAVLREALPVLARWRLRAEAAPAPDGELPETGGPLTGPASGQEPEALAGLGGEELARALTALLQTEMALALGHPEGHSFDMEQEFMDLGFTSLAAVEMRNRLMERTGLELPVTLVFDFLTPAELADHLRAALG